MTGTGAPLNPEFRPVADHAILVVFGETIGEAAHAAVRRLDRALSRHPFAGFAEAVPAYVSLLVDFDPLLTDHATAEAAVRALLVEAGGVEAEPAVRRVAVCYDGDLAPDLPEVARQTGLSAETVIAAHLAGDYRVFMYGFAPGYAYLAGVPEPIRLPRKATPLRGVAAGSVLIAGPQCLVSTLTMPTGWWIIGRSPTPILTGDETRPFLFDPGDRVVFARIGRADLEQAGKAAG
ncbi:MAG: allophanate hydrolase subunit 1 [Ancalomicrobiaceae bacterium]|nr:allophanate hydrolase subunit 1 [Ancalomicrobiaceae bacterium]